MKLKTIFFRSTSVAFAFAFISCSDDSSSTLDDVPDSAFNATTTAVVESDNLPAPVTLDKTKLSPLGIEDFSFYFNRTSGSTANGGTEVGFCDSFGTTTETFTLDLSSGNQLEYDLPDFVSDVTYTYTRSSDGNTGTIILTGNGVGDGGSRTGTESIENRMDIYVGSPFTATYNLVFGSSGGSVDNISIDSSVNGTSDFFYTTFDYIVNSAQNNVSLTLQNGSPVPLGYNSSAAANTTSSTPTAIYPTSLQAVAEIILTFNPATTTTSTTARYRLTNITSSPIGFPASTDQGITSLDLIDPNGSSTASEVVEYRWETNNTSNNIGKLTLNPTQSPSAISQVSYILDFSTNSSGNFNQVEVNSDGATVTTGTTGVFSLPFIANPVEEE